MRADFGQGLTRRAAVAGPLAAAALAAGGRYAEAQSADPWLLADQIRARIVVPTFPAREVTITAFGAVGDGHTLCTRAIMQADPAVSHGLMRAELFPFRIAVER